MSPAQLTVLERLDRTGITTAAEIADHTGLRTGCATRVLDALLRRSYVTVTGFDGLDLYRITAKGERRLARETLHA